MLRNIFTLHKLSIIVFSLYLSWILSFPFEGQVLYALAFHSQLDPHYLFFEAIGALTIGLAVSGFLIRSLLAAKKILLFSITLCLFGSFVFFTAPSALWYIVLCICSLFTGISAGAWGYLFRYGTPPRLRINTAADILIYSNIITIFSNIFSIYLSPYLGLGFSMLILILADCFAYKISVNQEEAVPPASELPGNKFSQTTIPLALLCLFIMILTINSGLMLQVIKPALFHHKWMIAWVWPIPYTSAIYIMKKLPNTLNRSYLLYVALSMMGLSFIDFISLGQSVIFHLIVVTLLLGACGIIDLFLWSILGEMLSLDKNPAKILGFGVSSNLIGILIGSMLGYTIDVNAEYRYQSVMLALAVICISLILLPLLHKRLFFLLDDPVYLTVFNKVSVTEPEEQNSLHLELLTERENEIAVLLLSGKTYRNIADDLFISENTVKTHIKNIYSKYGIKSRTELIHLMLEDKAEVAVFRQNNPFG